MNTFPSIAAFLAHMAGRVAAAEAAQAHAMDVAARIVQTEAKHELGRYQPEGGGFQAWPELADVTKEDRLSQGFTENEPLLRTGELRDSIQRDSNAHEAVVGSDSDIAVWQENGTSKIPPRSFLGHAAFVKEHEVIEAVALEVIHAVSGVRPNRL